MRLNSTKAMLINKAKSEITLRIGLDIKWVWVYNTHIDTNKQGEVYDKQNIHIHQQL
jgi:hypothetical protein